MLAAEEPEQPFGPTTVIVNDDVMVDWVAPDDNGSPLLYYNLLIKQADGGFSEDLTYCDGSNAQVMQS